MSSPKPISDRERTHVVADIDAGMHRNELARKYKRSPSTISKIAAQAGRSFDRTKTAAATQAFVVDMAARRAALAEGLLADAEYLRQRLREEHHQWISTPDGPEQVTLDKPPLRDVRDGMGAVGQAIASHAKLIEMDSDDADSDARSLMSSFGRMLGLDQ